jgi:ankyrin repeat protein
MFKLFVFSEPIQLVSIPISFISLGWASFKLYYFQRLGPYSDHDPSIKLFLVTTLPIIFLLSGNLYSLILISSYYQLWVVLVIGLSSSVHYIWLNAIYQKKTELDEIILMLYQKNKEFGTKETNHLFWMSVFTSWVAPCTVWANNKNIKKYFLLSSSAITIVVNLLSIAVVYTLVRTAGLIDNVNPPISHCHNDTAIYNESSYHVYDSSNSSDKLFNICGSDDCLPTIRMCPENESFFESLEFVCFMTGILLLFISAGASVCLQILGSSKINNQNLSTAPASVKNDKCKQTPLTKRKTNESNDLTSKSHDLENKLPEKTWSPMHEALKEKKYGLWCFYNILGGLESALNEDGKSTIQILSSESNDQCKWKRSNYLIKLWIEKSLQKYGKLPLHNAVELGDTILTEIIIETGYDIEEKNYLGHTALHIAAANGHLACLKYLIDKGADLEANDNGGMTPLHWSALSGQLECQKYLIDNGAILESKDMKGRTALLLSAKSGQLECLKYFIGKGADLEAKDNDGCTLLLLSVYKEHLECLKYLIDKGADLEAKDKRGRTPLPLLAQYGQLECLKYLIDKGADLEAKDKRGRTPLHSVNAHNGNLECLKYLIDKGADLEAKDNEGRTPLHSSAYLMYNLKTLKGLTFLIAQKAEVNARDNQNNTPLHILGRFFLEVRLLVNTDLCSRAFEELIKAGADLTAVNNKGKTPKLKFFKY